MQPLPPLSLYIHFPWCIQKCPYCDFNSHTLKQDLPEIVYVNRLLDDLTADLMYVQQRTITSIFMGGGTPSLFSAAALTHLLAGIRERLTLAPDCEITLEANPGTAEAQHFAGYRAAGINRLSLGVQSFCDTQLKQLGRIHNALHAHRAIEMAREAGFENFNLDLMYGLPNQTHSDLLQDLTTAIACAPTHISWYQLTLEPNTPFYKHPPTLPHDDALAMWEEDGRRLLSEHGYARYEISAYAKHDLPSRHNLNYWQYGDYLGIGAGAHSKLTVAETGSIHRLQKQKHPKRFLDASLPFIQAETVVAFEDRLFEFALNHFRLLTPIEKTLFEDRTHCNWQQFLDTLAPWEEKGCLKRTPDTVCLTDKGILFVNDITGSFLREVK